MELNDAIMCYSSSDLANQCLACLATNSNTPCTYGELVNAYETCRASCGDLCESMWWPLFVGPCVSCKGPTEGKGGGVSEEVYLAEK